MEPKSLEHFFFMGEPQRTVVQEWYQKNKEAVFGMRERSFFDIIGEAIAVVDYDYYIAAIEPSQSVTGKICYQSGKKVWIGLNCLEWERKAKKFSPNFGSELANLHELFLWYAYRVAKEYWTLKYICYNSSGEGNYYKGYVSAHEIEHSAARVVGGFADGVGNTYKIIKTLEGEFALCGGGYRDDGRDFPVAFVCIQKEPYLNFEYGTGCVVLKGRFLD